MGIKDLRARTGQPWSSCEEFYDFNLRGIVPDWMKPPERVAALPSAPAPRPAPTAAPAPVLASFVTSVSRLARMLFPAPAGMNWISATALIQKDHDFLVASGDQEDRVEVQGFPPGDEREGFWCWVYSPGDGGSALMEVLADDGDNVTIKGRNMATGEVKVLEGLDTDTEIRGIVIGALTALGAYEKLKAAKAATVPPTPPEAPSVP